MLAAREQDGAVHLLDVPYIAQSEALCGGAAAAMVLRFWGVTAVYAETFADLVDASAGGIRGDDLARAIEARGWQALTFAGDATLVRTHLLKRRPVIALIEDRPGRFHYVVIVGWQNGRVVLHDPARAPFRVLEESAFSAAWQRAEHWTMLALPGDSAGPTGVRGASGDAATTVETASDPRLTPVRPPSDPGLTPVCDGMVQEGVRLAGAGALDDSSRVLEAAADNCPGAAAPWRELAGLRAVKGDWAAAGSTAREALRRDPQDQHAWRILATSRFLEEDPDGALDAWNRLGEPLLDLVNITGLDRTRYRAAADTLRLRPNTVLRARDLQAARRRLAELPSALGTRVTFVPGDDGRARVDASVVERPLAPTAPLPLAVMALRGITDRDVRVSFASLSGGGELWTAQWRWWERRPRAALTLTVPAPPGAGGTWSVEGYAERQTYRAGAADREETRRGATFRVSDWPSGTTRWHSAFGVDHWSDSGATVMLEGGAARHLLQDRFVGEVTAAVFAGGVRTWTVRGRGEWRSRTRHEGVVWLARGGYDVAGGNAPFALWPGAATGPGRDVLLRAHRMLDGGVIRNAVFGRRLAHAGAESRRWFAVRRKPLRIAIAGFADVARARLGLDSSDLRVHVDAGAGARIALPGAGILRIDLARGLRDGNTVLSFGWTK
jgi:hypothetical protein